MDQWTIKWGHGQINNVKLKHQVITWISECQKHISNDSMSETYKYPQIILYTKKFNMLLLIIEKTGLITLTEPSQSGHGQLNPIRETPYNTMNPGLDGSNIENL